MSYPSFLSGFFSVAAACLLASTQPALATSPEMALTVSSVHVTKAPGGSYISGSLQPSFGFTAPLNPHVHVTVYGVKGNVLITKIDKVSRNQLVRSHLQPRPRASYVAFVPLTPSEISRTTVVAHSRNLHAAS